ncbi:hypothetical protein T06_13562 [Trichinella sp. T6]|nr:hypothetical protein T06_13562 [Trichinella sp. T6]
MHVSLTSTFGANAPNTIIDKYRFRTFSNTIPNQRAILFKQQRTANITVKHLPVTYFTQIVHFISHLTYSSFSSCQPVLSSRLQTPDP